MVLRTGGVSLALAVALAIGSAWTGPAPAGADCAAWPGEPDPLPSAESTDPAEARWAELRAAELERWAQALDGGRPATAYRLRRHASCMAPAAAANEPAGAAAQPVRVFRPEVAFAAARVEVEALAPDADFAAVLEAPLGVPRPPPPGPSPSRLAEIDTLLERAGKALDAARFAEAIVSTDQVRSGLVPYPATRTVRTRRVRAEVLAATAAIALGQVEAAERSLGRAIEADPQLALDPMTTSPKVVRALDRARAERGAAQ